MQKVSIDNYSKELKRAGLKMTYPRQRIFKVFQKNRNPLSAQEVASRVIDIHFVTVYRNLDSLSDAGILVKLPHGFKYKYELSDKFLPHHHHAVCLKCGATFNLKSQHIEYSIQEASELAGIRPISHHVEVSGFCKKCDN